MFVDSQSQDSRSDHLTFRHNLSHISDVQNISNLESRNLLLVLRSIIIKGSFNSIISHNLSSISLLIRSFASEASSVNHDIAFLILILKDDELENTINEDLTSFFLI